MSKYKSNYKKAASPFLHGCHLHIEKGKHDIQQYSMLHAQFLILAIQYKHGIDIVLLNNYDQCTCTCIYAIVKWQNNNGQVPHNVHVYLHAIVSFSDCSCSSQLLLHVFPMIFTDLSCQKSPCSTYSTCAIRLFYIIITGSHCIVKGNSDLCIAEIRWGG